MAKTLVLKAEARKHTGTRIVQKMREQGKIPAIIYGHKEEPMAISLDAHSFIEALHHGHRLIDIQTGSKKEKALIKELQYDHLGKNVIHADLMRVDVTEIVKVTVPIEIKGAAKGLQEGGIVELHTNRVDVECLVSDIPEKIIVLVKDMGIGDAIHARDIELPENVKLAIPPETLIVTCHLVITAKTTEEVEAETPVTPEVISEKKETEEETAEQ
jgi:large subunit ribosomal protein L25